MSARSRVGDSRKGARFVVVVTTALLLSAPTADSWAEVLRVPFQYLTIPSALAVAGPGDTVLVSAGRYFSGTSRPHVRPGVTVLAAGARDETFWRITDGVEMDAEPGSGVSIIEGFTLEMASANADGVISSNPLAIIRNNRLVDIASGGGFNFSGIFCSPCALVERNWISVGALWSISIEAGPVTVRHNLLTRCPYSPAIAMEIEGPDSVFVDGNTFGEDQAYVLVYSGFGNFPYVEFVNNVFDGFFQSCIRCAGPGPTYDLHVRYNLFGPAAAGCSGLTNCPESVDLGPGNIFGEPAQFCKTTCWDHRLQPTSPAVGSGEGGVNMGAFGVGCDAVDVEETSTAADVIGRVHPNPALGERIVIPLRPAARGTFVVIIHDATGRLVRNIDGDSTAGEIVWDGHDRSGQLVSSGVYFLTIIQEGETLSTQRVRLVR